MSILSRFITDSTGKVNLRKMFDHFYMNGINILEDIRFNNVLQTISPGDSESKRPWEESFAVRMFGEEIDVRVMEAALKESSTFKKYLAPDFEYKIRNFQRFKMELEEVYEECKKENSGEITTYIPSLAEYHHDKWAVSFCSVDGQISNMGDFTDMFTIQSVTKPLLYGIVSDDIGPENVHKYIGREPSGFGFNKIRLSYTAGDIPHNPLINTGAITAASLVAPNMPPSKRFDHCFSRYARLAKGSQTPIAFNNTVYLSEKHMGHRNYAILHYLVNKGCISNSISNAGITEIIDLYFQLCSIEMNTQALAVVGGTLANGGINIFTKNQVFTPQTVQNMLSLMLMCGMYDYSGHWAFDVGLPAKSGVSGSILVVIPGVGGLAMWAPLLDTYGNSVKGVKFMNRLQLHSCTVNHLLRNVEAEHSTIKG